MARRLHTLLFGAAALLAAGCYSDDDGDRDNSPDPVNTGDAQVGGDAGASDASAAPPRLDAGTDCSRLTDPIQMLACTFGARLDGGAGFPLPTDSQCRNPTDRVTQILCGFIRRDAGATPPRDAGRADAGRDAGRPDAGRDAGRDAAVIRDAAADAEAAPDSGSDAGVPTDAATDAEAVDAAPVDDAAVVPDAATDDASVEADAAVDPDAATPAS